MSKTGENLGANKKPVKLTNVKRTRLAIIKAVCVAAFSVIFIHVWIYKTFRGEEFEQKTKSQSGAYMDSTIPAMRGSIYASTGECLAYSTKSYSIIVDPYVLNKATTAQQTSTVDLLCKVLHISDKTTISKYLGEEYASRRYEALECGKNISAEQKELLDKYISEGDIKGIWYEEKEERIYPYDEYLAQVLGFGKVYGLDASYNDELTGTDGRKLMVATSDGEYSTQETAAVDGNNLVLTINWSVQQVMEEKMAQAMEKTNALQACAICMNPQTGEIYGWVNYPTFNLNNINELVGTTERFLETYAQTQDYAQRVWNNMGINYTFQPGSTFKPMVAAISLEEDVVSLKEKFFCGNDGYHVPGTDNYIIRCIYHNIHGYETLSQILLNSCNQGMAQVVERIDKNTFWNYLNDLGLGKKTGIDLPNENSAENLVYTMDNLGIAEKAACSFGQGFNLTPLQLITAFSSVINGGKIVQPHLVSSVEDEDGKIIYSNKTQISKTVFSDETSETVRQFLADCYKQYNGWGTISVQGYNSMIGAKTGTAEQGHYGVDACVVNFETFVPIDNPQVTLLVVMDYTDSQNSRDPQNLSQEMLKEILPILGIYGE